MTETRERTLDASQYTGEQVRSLFEARYLKHRAGCAALGITQGTFSKKIQGKVPITVDELMKLARLLGVEPGQLLPRLDSNQQPSGYPLLQVAA